MPRARARALPHEVRDLRRRIRERDRGRFGQHAVAGLEEAPGHDDVLADRVGPTADASELVASVEREGALRDQSRLVEALHALHRGNTEEVIPFLHASQQVLARVTNHHRPRYGNGVGWRALDSRHEPAQRLDMEERVRIERDDQGCLDEPERLVQRVRLSRFRFVHHHERDAELGRSVGRDLAGQVGRAVVGEHERDRPRIVGADRRLDRLPDSRRLVARRDHNRHSGTGMRELQLGLAIEEQRHRHERHDQGGDVRDERDDHDRAHFADVPAEITKPRQRKPDRSRDPQQGKDQRDPELRGDRDVPLRAVPRYAGGVGRLEYGFGRADEVGIRRGHAWSSAPIAVFSSPGCAATRRLGGWRVPLLTWLVGFGAGISRLSAAKPILLKHSS